MDILKYLSGNFEGLSEEEKIKLEKFNNKLKEAVIEDLIKKETEELIEKLKSDKEDFIESIDTMLRYGNKGYNKMSMQLLLNIYLEKNSDSDFIKLIENLE